MRSPLATPAQLQMLIDGLYGDPGPARRDLALEPVPFSADSVRALAPRIVTGTTPFQERGLS